VPYVFIILSLDKSWLTDDPPVQPISEKIDGLKEEIKGKIKHDPELVAHGRERRTGRKEMKEVDFLRPYSLPTTSPKVSPVGPRVIWSTWPNSPR